MGLPPEFQGSGFRVQDLAFRVQGLGSACWSPRIAHIKDPSPMI